jgi:hypothetical protein
MAALPMTDNLVQFLQELLIALIGQMGGWSNCKLRLPPGTSCRSSSDNIDSCRPPAANKERIDGSHGT